MIWKGVWRHTPVRPGSYWTIPGFLISFDLKVNTFHPWIFQALSSILSIHPRLAVSSLATTGVASPSLTRLYTLYIIQPCYNRSSQSFTYKVIYIILYTVSSLAITGVASPSLTRLYTLYFIQSGVDSVKKYLPGGEWFSINWCGGGGWKVLHQTSSF